MHTDSTFLHRHGNRDEILHHTVRVIELNDDEALLNYAKPIVAELRANMVRVDADILASIKELRTLSYGTGRSR